MQRGGYSGSDMAAGGSVSSTAVVYDSTRLQAEIPFTGVPIGNGVMARRM
jgi:hypothetical protein